MSKAGNAAGQAGRTIKPRLRIAFIGLHYAEYSWNLVRALAERHDVLAIFNANNFRDELGQPPDISPSQHLELVFLPHVGTVSVVVSNAWRIVREVRRFSPDVVHCQENGKDYLMLALPWLFRYPWVLTIHDPAPHSGADTRTRKSRYGRYLRILRESCDAAIAHGEFLRDEVERIVPGLRGRVHPVLHGPLGLDGTASEGDAPKWEAGNLLFFGRMESYKGLEYFIAAVRQAAARGTRVRGVIAGRGADLDRHRAALDGDPLFEIHDGYIARDEVMRLFEKAQAVVLPYTDGTQSGVAALAMGCGRPVIASRVGSIPELVRDGVNGLLVPPRDAEALTSAVIALLTGTDSSLAMARAARMLAHGELSWAALSERVEVAYHAAMRRRGMASAANGVQDA